MRSIRLEPTDAIGGVLVTLIGLVTAGISSQYPIGRISNIGPGAFPLALGIIMVLLGLGIIAGSVGRTGSIPQPNWRAAGVVMLSLTCFALLIGSFGLVPAIFVSAFIARFADNRFHFRRVFVLACSLALLCWVIFIALLGLPIAVLELPL